MPKNTRINTKTKVKTNTKTNAKSGSIKTIIVVTLIALFSESFGFLRDVLIAYRYGTGVVSDTYFTVAGITILLFNLIMNSVTTTVIPVLTQIGADHGKSAKVKYTGRFLSIIGLISIVLVSVAQIFSPQIIKIIATGFSSEQFELAVKLLRLGIPGIIFSATVGVLAGFLQSEGKYYSSSSMRIIFNFTCIIYLFFFSGKYGISGLMVAAVIGTSAQFLALGRDLKQTGYTLSFSLSPLDFYVKKIMQLSLPVFLGIAIYDLNTMLDRAFASTLFVGNISQLTYANKIETLVISIFISAITTVVYPEFSQKIAEQDNAGLKVIFKKAINICLIIAIPATFGLIILGQPIVQVLYQRGEFTAAATIKTGQILACYALGLVGKSLREMILRVFYAMQENRKTIFNAALTLLINFVLNFAIIKTAKVEYLALATSLAIIISTLVLLYQLRLKIGKLGLKSSLVYGIKSAFAAILMTVVAVITYKTLNSKIDSTSNNQVLLILSATVLLAIIVYFSVIYFLKIEEINEIANMIFPSKKKNQKKK